jgi:hypothetical protein
VSSLGNFVWSIADQLRGVYKPRQYGGVILPFAILRRLDCILEPTRDPVRVHAKKYDSGALDVKVRQKIGFRFYNTSEYDFAKLLADPEGLRSNSIDNISRFSREELPLPGCHYVHWFNHVRLFEAKRRHATSRTRGRLLPSQQRPRRGRLIQQAESPDTPGRFTDQGAKGYDTSVTHDEAG